MKKLLCTAALLAMLGGCVAVKPWERDTLARSDMQLAPDKVQASFDSHIYFSKEGASGGGGFAAGGCGCN